MAGQQWQTYLCA